MMKPIIPAVTPGMKARTLPIVLETEKSGPGLAASSAEAVERVRAVLIMRISKVLFVLVSAWWWTETVHAGLPETDKGETEAQQ